MPKFRLVPGILSRTLKQPGSESAQAARAFVWAGGKEVRGEDEF